MAGPAGEAFLEKTCVYCAGPLFNGSERREMEAIAGVLEAAGGGVYLPHRDGMEFRVIHHILVERGWPAPTAAKFLHAAIFALDIYQLVTECDAVVWNLNGRTPDEGAVSEAAIAWTLGKPLVAYRDDVRSLIAGRVNPLLVGLVDFTTVEQIEEIPAALTEAVRQQEVAEPALSEMPPRIQRAVGEGERLWQAINKTGAEDDERLADLVAELFAPAPETAL